MERLWNSPIVSGAAGAVLAVVVLAVLERSWGLAQIIAIPSVPSGAVVAFDSECPEGWENYQLGAGRFLLGASKKHAFHDEGGEETHTLTVPQMPHHNHNKGGLLLVKRTGGNTVHARTDNTGNNEINIRYGFDMVAMGNSQPHNNMPPFLVVNFCEKK